MEIWSSRRTALYLAVIDGVGKKTVHFGVGVHRASFRQTHCRWRLTGGDQLAPALTTHRNEVAQLLTSRHPDVGKAGRFGWARWCGRGFENRSSRACHWAPPFSSAAIASAGQARRRLMRTG